MYRKLKLCISCPKMGPNCALKNENLCLSQKDKYCRISSYLH